VVLLVEEACAEAFSNRLERDGCHVYVAGFRDISKYLGHYGSDVLNSSPIPQFYAFNSSPALVPVAWRKCVHFFGCMHLGSGRTLTQPQ